MLQDTVNIKGLTQLGKLLRELPKNVELRVLRKAVSQPAQYIKQRAKQIAPVYQGELPEGMPAAGTLKQAIQVKRVTGGPSNRVIYIVFVRHGAKFRKVGKNQVNKDAYYWWWVEFGTSKMTARPFLRPAFEAGKGDALVLLTTALEVGIAKEAQALSWGKPTL